LEREKKKIKKEEPGRKKNDFGPPFWGGGSLSGFRNETKKKLSSIEQPKKTLSLDLSVVYGL